MEISKEELEALIKKIVDEVVTHNHTCKFDEQQRSLIMDICIGGKIFKQVVLYLLALSLAAFIGLKLELLKLFKG